VFRQNSSPRACSQPVSRQQVADLRWACRADDRREAGARFQAEMTEQYCAGQRAAKPSGCSGGGRETLEVGPGRETHGHPVSGGSVGLQWPANAGKTTSRRLAAALRAPGRRRMPQPDPDVSGRPWPIRG